MPTRCSIPLENLRSCSAALGADADAIEHRVHPRAAIRPRESEQLPEVMQQLFGREVVVEIGIFGEVADALAHRHVADGATEDLGAARRSDKSAASAA